MKKKRRKDEWSVSLELRQRNSRFLVGGFSRCSSSIVHKEFYRNKRPRRRRRRQPREEKREIREEGELWIYIEEEFALSVSFFSLSPSICLPVSWFFFKVVRLRRDRYIVVVYGNKSKIGVVPWFALLYRHSRKGAPRSGVFKESMQKPNRFSTTNQTFLQWNRNFNENLMRKKLLK